MAHYLPDYVTWRGDLSFAADPANDLDTLVMAALSYIDLPTETQSFAQCASVVPLDDPNDTFRGECLRLLQQIAKSNRFGALPVRDAVSVLNDEVQFAAMTVDLPDGTHIIAFRGTDGSLTGWREDFAMSFESPVPAQAAAQAYLERHLSQDSGDFIVTGHSKGGNLAVYAAAHMAAGLQGRIRRVVSFDGPGVDDETAASDGYAAVTSRIIAYVPQFAVVGLLMAAHPVHRVVMSDNNGIMQHDPFSWEVLAKDFCYAEGLDKGSILVNQTVHQWLAQCTREQRRTFVDGIFDLLASTQRINWKELRKDVHAGVAAIRSVRGQIDIETARMIANLLGRLAVIGVGNALEMLRQQSPFQQQAAQEATQNEQGGLEHV